MSMTYLDVSDELLCWCFDGNFTVYSSLYGIGPPHGFIQHFGVQPVGVLSPMHNYVPVTFNRKKPKKVIMKRFSPTQ